MKYALAFLLAFTPLAVFGEAAEGELNCAAIENARERLACYDRAYSDRPMPPPKIRTEVIAPPATLGQPSTAATRQSGTPDSSSSGNEANTTLDSRIDSATAPTARRGTAAPTSESKRSGGMFSRSEKVEFSSTIRTIRDEDDQRMIFLLDNEQIWIQAAPRFIPFKEGDVVTIKSGLIGGFTMRNEKDVTTRVQRIK